MRIMRTRHNERRGATAVETAVVISIALLFVFGIVEYARYIFFLQSANNAAREAARYAAAHTNDGTAIGNLNDAPVFDSSNPNFNGAYLAPNTSIRAVVGHQIGNHKNTLANYNVQVYNADPSTGQSLGGNWNDSPFAGGIVVEISGNYQFFLPTLLQLPSGNLAVKVKAMMTSEAN
jgi:Flp pilus assembly protein TadG